MFYTIGHTKNYLNAFQQPGARVFKNMGGYVFLTREEAQRRIIEEGKEGEWSIFGLKAEFHQLQPSSDGWWHELKEQAEIFLLDT